LSEEEEEEAEEEGKHDPQRSSIFQFTTKKIVKIFGGKVLKKSLR